ncbi:uncharacterized protein M6B38_394380 [Iris pallida]|uniref:Uncharacterized protein n=1 Tax=Iris pallida TaxID=29817 RepID=A0AAX6FT25_IRIPA|nr:uncharacterized protein M6B38_402915 [Iris pallida]KAJ6820930.1 uncharacterized protein M6B38_394380 [Iris pallida]
MDCIKRLYSIAAMLYSGFLKELATNAVSHPLLPAFLHAVLQTSYL